MAERHGMTHTRVHSIWTNMLSRCHTDPQGTYGKRGITVCQEWEHSFLKFYQDMGEPPSPEHSIDRINTRGNYEPGNCRWATRKEQARNTTKNTFLVLNGQSKTIAEWSEITGIKSATICVRLANGMSHEEALDVFRNGDDRIDPAGHFDPAVLAAFLPSAAWAAARRAIGTRNGEQDT